MAREQWDGSLFWFCRLRPRCKKALRNLPRRGAVAAEAVSVDYQGVQLLLDFRRLPASAF
jgi:hypothetical protein